MSDTDAVVDAVTDILTDRCRLGDVAAAERSGWLEPAWRALADGGFCYLSVPEAQGGPGGDLADAAAMLTTAGRFALPLPLAEASLTAGWALGEAGAPLPDRPVTAAPADSALTLTRTGAAWSLDGVLRRVPWGQRSERVVTVIEAEGATWVLSLDTGRATVRAGRNLAGEPRDDLSFERVALIGDDVFAAPPGVTVRAFELRGALGRAALIAGACARVGELTNRYVGERLQFGRPLSRFQAVQRLTVQVAGESTLIDLAVRAAVFGGALGELDVAAAKSVASRGASIVAAAAHQAHGAIGLTEEYELGQLTRRLWSWRDEYGTERYWNRLVGARVVDAGADHLWASLAS